MLSNENSSFGYKRLGIFYRIIRVLFTRERPSNRLWIQYSFGIPVYFVLVSTTAQRFRLRLPLCGPEFEPQHRRSGEGSRRGHATVVVIVLSQHLLLTQAIPWWPCDTLPFNIYGLVSHPLPLPLTYLSDSGFLPLCIS